MKGVQHFLLSYAERPVSNVSIRVDNVKRRETGNQAELVLDVLVLAERQPGQSGSAPQQLSEQQAQELRQLVSAQAAGLVFLPGRYGFQETLNISAFPHRRRRSITRGSTAMAIRR